MNLRAKPNDVPVTESPVGPWQGTECQTLETKMSKELDPLIEYYRGDRSELAPFFYLPTKDALFKRIIT